MAVTMNVTSMDTKKYVDQIPMRPRVRATTSRKVTETVEKPVAMMAASLAV